MAPRSSRRLTVFFDSQFWVGLAEIEDCRSYRVARHVFGPEPSEPEVALFALSDWGLLRFADGHNQDAPLEASRKTGYKRMLRESKRELLAQERRSASSERKAAAADAACKLRRAKQKARHRGK